VRKTSNGRPVLFGYTGSFAAELAIPRLAMYSCSKAFINRLTLSLHAEERFDGHTNISFMYFEVGTVVTNIWTPSVSFTCPSSEVFSKALVGCLGCGRQEVIPYIGHTVGAGFNKLIPKWLQTIVLAIRMKKITEELDKQRKDS
jgi:17beta-estradiol 17-dehydrogenase / very-long-chain 3-oxoacyl-CoA reductase